MSEPSLLLGVMSGTSLDGVDYALCACRGRRSVELVRHWRADFSTGLHRRLEAAAAGAATAWEVGQLHHDLGRFYARAARTGLRGETLSAVGLHGQTIFHQTQNRTPATFQIGESAYLVEALGVPVVSNFRAADLAGGGQGAPLATLFHQIVFAERGRYVAIHNLGGISNVTALDWTNRKSPQPRVLAFDTGPANLLLDQAARELSAGRFACDWNGRWARRGLSDSVLLAGWLRHPFLRKRPPKSTGREEFGEPFWRRAVLEIRQRRLKPEDALATLTEFTARSIALNYERFLPNASGSLPDRVILAGGGAANPVLRQRIQHALTGLAPMLRVETVDALGWPHQTIEAAAFALLAHYRIRRWPGNLPNTTGAAGARLLGQVARPPASYPSLRK